MTFEAPLFLVLAGLVPLVWWRWLRRSRHAALRFSSVAPVRRLGGTVRTRLRHSVPVMRSLAILLLAICLARPQAHDEQTRIFSEGIAIQLLVDRSGSMQAMDFTVNGEPVDRLTAVKGVVQDFVRGDDRLEGRGDDLIGMIVFAGFADSRCPLTLDHAYLLDTLDETEIVDAQTEGRDEDGTAIGEAMALGVEKLRDMERRRSRLDADPVKGKIMVLLTDGENNRGDIAPRKAAQIAAAYDIRIYTIGAGTKGMAPVPALDFLGRRILRQVPVNIDEETLRDIASITGGQYFRATDTNSLREIYAEIDKLERTKIEEKRYRQTKELATAGVRLGPLPLPSPLLLVFIILGLEVLVANTVFRRIP
jgi:Ca-activated chloride channel family protein